jgi:hypothetical protein
MSITRRLRSYFFGPDGESYKKFSTGNKPDKRMFSYLFDSIGFLKNSDDTATTSMQGFCKLSTDAKTYALDSTKDIDSYSLVVQPHQLPSITAGKYISLTKSEVERSTGGIGANYEVSLDLNIYSNSDILTITEEDNTYILNIDAEELNIAIDNQIESNDTITELEEDVESLQTNVNGKLGEIKMYSYSNKGLGDTSFAFDVDGIGRKDTDWEGWIILMNQSVSTLLTAGADSSLLSRFTGYNGYIVDTRTKYPIGIGSESLLSKGFNNLSLFPLQTIGKNSYTLTQDDVPLKDHYHELTDDNFEIDITINDTGSDHIHTISAENGETGVGVATSGTASGTFNTTKSGEHSHTVNDQLNEDKHRTEYSDDDTANTIDNKPLSFVVCYCAYVGIPGSEL